ncbi:serine/threonine-protein kinase LMTK1 [Callorhinchus milii]|uniref:serine/threonine-protein kinase LMTK1 n=1 Tax=Callorhinchus milii TaxID=7868 RepID=UPI001C3F747A|nr:serine/threonine-protein kinase LMTK1 [Callorhinchus milii]
MRTCYLSARLFLISVLCNISQGFSSHFDPDGAPISELTWSSSMAVVAVSFSGLFTFIFLMLACLCCRKGDIGFKEPGSGGKNISHKEFENNDGEDYTADFSPRGTPGSQNGPEVYILPLTEVSLPVSNQPLARSGQFLQQTDIGRQCLLYLKEMGLGWFGKVFLGEVNAGLNSCQVVVKELKAGASLQDQMRFLEEAQPHRNSQHPNLLQCLAQFTEVSPYLLVMEFCHLGDVKGYLRTRSAADEMAPDPSTLQRMACEITSGLQHLHKHNYIHSDLALRNCLLTADLTIKIGDYGLSHSKYKKDYLLTPDQLWVPLRWIAPELIDDVHGNLLVVDQTKVSNIWSLGVTLWELFEFGNQPYHRYTDKEVLAYTIKEQQLKLPRPLLKLALSDRWYEVMQFCWLQPEQRPTADEVHLLLSYLCAKASSEAEEEFEKRWNAMKPSAATGSGGGGGVTGGPPAPLSSFPLLEQFGSDGFQHAETDDVLTVTETSQGLNFEYKWEHQPQVEHILPSPGGAAAQFQEIYFPNSTSGRLSLSVSPISSNSFYEATQQQGVPQRLQPPGVVPVISAHSPSVSGEYYIRIEEPTECNIDLDYTMCSYSPEFDRSFPTETPSPWEELGGGGGGGGRKPVDDFDNSPAISLTMEPLLGQVSSSQRDSWEDGQYGSKSKVRRFYENLAADDEANQYLLDDFADGGGEWRALGESPRRDPGELAPAVSPPPPHTFKGSSSSISSYEGFEETGSNEHLVNGRQEEPSPGPRPPLDSETEGAHPLADPLDGHPNRPSASPPTRGLPTENESAFFCELKSWESNGFLHGCPADAPGSPRGGGRAGTPGFSPDWEAGEELGADDLEQELSGLGRFASLSFPNASETHVCAPGSGETENQGCVWNSPSALTVVGLELNSRGFGRSLFVADRSDGNPPNDSQRDPGEGGLDRAPDRRFQVSKCPESLDPLLGYAVTDWALPSDCGKVRPVSDRHEEPISLPTLSGGGCGQPDQAVKTERDASPRASRPEGDTETGDEGGPSGQGSETLVDRGQPVDSGGGGEAEADVEETDPSQVSESEEGNAGRSPGASAETPDPDGSPVKTLSSVSFGETEVSSDGDETDVTSGIFTDLTQEYESSEAVLSHKSLQKLVGTPDSLESLDIPSTTSSCDIFSPTASHSPCLQPRAADSGYDTENFESPEFVPKEPAETGKPGAVAKPAAGSGGQDSETSQDSDLPDADGKNPYRDSAYFSDYDAESERCQSSEELAQDEADRTLLSKGRRLETVLAGQVGHPHPSTQADLPHGVAGNKTSEQCGSISDVLPGALFSARTSGVAADLSAQAEQTKTSPPVLGFERHPPASSRAEDEQKVEKRPHLCLVASEGSGMETETETENESALYQVGYVLCGQVAEATYPDSPLDLNKGSLAQRRAPDSDDLGFEELRGGSLLHKEVCLHRTVGCNFDGRQLLAGRKPSQQGGGREGFYCTKTDIQMKTHPYSLNVQEKLENFIVPKIQSVQLSLQLPLLSLKKDSKQVLEGEEGDEEEEEDEESEDSDEELGCYNIQEPSEESEEEAPAIPIIVTEKDDGKNLRSLLKMPSLMYESFCEDLDRKKKAVSFYDDVTVYLFDQESPTSELSEQNIPEVDPTSQRPAGSLEGGGGGGGGSSSDPGSADKQNASDDSSDGNFSEEGSGFEWDDDFTVITEKPSFAPEAALSPSEAGPSAASRPEPIPVQPTRFSRFTVSPATVSRFSITHVSDSDMDSIGGSSEEGERE